MAGLDNYRPELTLYRAKDREKFKTGWSRAANKAGKRQLIPPGAFAPNALTPLHPAPPIETPEVLRPRLRSPGPFSHHRHTHKCDKEKERLDRLKHKDDLQRQRQLQLGKMERELELKELRASQRAHITDAHTANFDPSLFSPAYTGDSTPSRRRSTVSLNERRRSSMFALAGHSVEQALVPEDPEPSEEDDDEDDDDDDDDTPQARARSAQRRDDRQQNLSRSIEALTQLELEQPEEEAAEDVYEADAAAFFAQWQHTQPKGGGGSYEDFLGSMGEQLKAQPDHRLSSVLMELITKGPKAKPADRSFERDLWLRKRNMTVKRKIDPSLRAQYKQIFGLLDENNDGLVDLAQMLDAMQRILGLYVSERELAHMCASIDQFNGQDLTFDQFVSGFASMSEWDQLAEVRKMRQEKGIRQAPLSFALWVPAFHRAKVLQRKTGCLPRFLPKSYDENSDLHTNHRQSIARAEAASGPASIAGVGQQMPRRSPSRHHLTGPLEGHPKAHVKQRPKLRTNHRSLSKSQSQGAFQTTRKRGVSLREMKRDQQTSRSAVQLPPLPSMLGSSSDPNGESYSLQDLWHVVQDHVKEHLGDAEDVHGLDQ